MGIPREDHNLGVGSGPHGAMTARVLASESLRKFGGDSVDEFRRNYAAYLASLGETPSAARPLIDG